MYEIRFASSVEKDVRHLPKDVLRQCLNKIEQLLKVNPFAGEKLKLNREILYRYRVRDYRIVYTVNTDLKTVTIYKIRHRREVYRDL